jgi:hypothetical protein
LLFAAAVSKQPNRPKEDLMHRRIPILLLAAACFALIVTTTAGEQFPDHGFNPNPELFQRDARPYGKSMATWAELASQWVYAQPLEQSPLFDPTGANCDVDQQGPVWYVARIAGPPVFSGTRTCTIPHQKSILLYIGAVVDTYPCPVDPNFQPAPGQSLYDFLAADAKFFMDSVDSLSVTLDGQPLDDVFSYRFVSPDLFSITGDPSLQPVLDGCITGSPQQAVVDGFFMMFKPLDPGLHTIVVRGTNTFGHDKTFTYYLNVE